MRRILLVALTLVLVGLSGAFASGHGGGDRHAPTFVDELAPLSVCATFLGGHEGTGVQVSTTGYGARTPSPLPGTTAGDAVDFNWVWDNRPAPSPLVWDFGVEVKRVRMYPSIDHDEPLPGEALESTVYSSDSATGPWVAARLKKVYVPGWNPGWVADDYVSEWRLQSTDRYVAVSWGGPGALYADGDAEIDAMCRAGDRAKGHSKEGHGHDDWGKGHDQGWKR